MYTYSSIIFFDPEKIHYFTFSLVRFTSRIPGFSAIYRSLYLVEDKRLETEVFGLKFKNPVGLALVLIKTLSCIKNCLIWFWVYR
jgi:hypothetical protein